MLKTDFLCDRYIINDSLMRIIKNLKLFRPTPAAKQIVNLVIRDKEFEKTASKQIIRSSAGK